jgi:GNAT superfamily N-acetyltransferase
MSGYRFCRTDDVALLVDAYERCRGSHLAAEPALTVAAFKRAAKEIGLWASSCMLAIEGDEAVGVLLGAKNGTGNSVQRIAIREDHQRRGHGRHLLESLRNKVAILGPPRLVAEVPAAWDDVCRFFERSGFAAETRYADVVAENPALPRSGLAAAITIDDLVESGTLAGAPTVAWEQAPEVIRRRSQTLQALAIASDVRIEAHAVFRPDDADATEIVSLSFTRPEALSALIGDVCALRGGPVRVLRAGSAAVEALERLGFRHQADYVGYLAQLPSSV